MLPDYKDIRDRVQEEPSWWDSNGVPRYGDFHPNMLGIYDDLAMLYRIACQACGQEFSVAVGSSDTTRMRDVWLQAGLAALNKHSVKENYITGERGLRKYATQWAQSPHYGDPPRHGCVGDTMNCEDLEVLQAWIKPSFKEWSRMRKLEGVLDEQG